MSQHTNGQMVERFTWTQRDPDNRENPMTELDGNRKAKYNSNPLAPPGHGIYPICNPQYLISTEIHFNTEMTKPQRNYCLGENACGSCIKDRNPFSGLATIELLSGVRTSSEDAE